MGSQCAIKNLLSCDIFAGEFYTERFVIKAMIYTSNLINIRDGSLSKFKLVVRVEGIEPSSHAWEAYIIAIIRYPRVSIIHNYRVIFSRGQAAKW